MFSGRAGDWPGRAPTERQVVRTGSCLPIPSLDGNQRSSVARILAARLCLTTITRRADFEVPLMPLRVVLLALALLPLDMAATSDARTQGEAALLAGQLDRATEVLDEVGLCLSLLFMRARAPTRRVDSSIGVQR